MRLSRVILMSLLTLAGFFCGAQTGTSTFDSIYNGGEYRKYRMYIPANYNPNKSFPLVINLHGLSSNAIQQQYYSNFMLIADTASFLVVHPEGTSSNGTQFWNPGLLPTPNDVAFISALLDTLDKKYNVDNNAVYSCGLSNGAILSYYLVCSMPNRIAAIASVAGTMFRPWFESCNPKVAVPVMVVHGTEDGTVPYLGNSSGGTAGLYMPTDSIVRKWVLHNRCDPTSVVTDLPDLNTTDLSTVRHYKYSLGADGSSVELYKIIGGSHSWPGAVPVIYKTNQDYNASVEIWRFFRQYRLNQFVTQVGVPDITDNVSQFKMYPNPSEGKVFVEGMKNFSYSICSVDGRVLYSSIYDDHIALEKYAAGVYFIKISADQKQIYRKIVKN